MTHLLTATKSGDAHVAAFKQVAMMLHRQALTLTYLRLLLAKPTGATVAAH